MEKFPMGTPVVTYDDRLDGKYYGRQGAVEYYKAGDTEVVLKDKDKLSYFTVSANSIRKIPR